MEDERENEERLKEKMLHESVRVQKTLYMQEQLAKRHQAEERLLEQLLNEQRVIDGLEGSLDESMERTAETRHYNRELKESMERQVYALHGISEDMLTGMQEYKNAYYRGCAAALFLLSVGLTVLCGLLHGFGEGITLLVLAGTALQGALLAQEKKRVLCLDVLCRLLYLLLFPLLLIMFVLYELGYAEYERFLPYASMGALALTVLGTFSYFLYNPYHKAHRRVRSARGQIGEIEKIAGKEARKSRRLREKAEKRSRRQAEKEEEALRRRQAKEGAAAARAEERKEAAAARREQWQEWKGRLTNRIKKKSEKPETIALRTEEPKPETAALKSDEPGTAQGSEGLAGKPDVAAEQINGEAAAAVEPSLVLDGITENI